MKMLFRSVPGFRSLIACVLIAGATVSLVAVALGAPQPGPDFVVNTLADSDDGLCDNVNCSLREAINAANNYGNGARITFSLSGTITVGAPLPNMTKNMTVDGSGQRVTVSGNDSTGIFFAYNASNTVNFNALTVARARGNVPGALYARYAAVNITNCTFRDNTNPFGGTGAPLFFNESTTVVIANSTFYNNTGQQAGTIYLNGSPLTRSHIYVYNSTFAGNRSVVSSAAADIVADGSGQAELRNVLFSTNPSSGNPNCTGITFADSSDLYNAGTIAGATKVTAAQLNLGTINNNGGPTDTIALLPGSVAINAGNNSYASAAAVGNLDQRGYDRVRGGDPTADVGAFEYGSTGSLQVNTTEDSTSTAARSLRNALAYAQSLGGTQVITFSPALAGQTITLSNPSSNADGHRSSSALAIESGSNITIQGPTSRPGITLKVADGVPLRHFVVSSGASLTLANLTLTGGKPSLSGFAYGGAIWNFGAFAARGCTFFGNNGPAEGGAIQSWGGSQSLLIENSTFSGNSTLSNGSAIVTGATQNTFRYLTVTGNTGPNVLALFNDSTTMLNAIIAGNSNDTVASFGGGTFSTASTNNLLGAGTAPGLSNGVNANRLGVPVAQLMLGALADNGGPTPTIALGLNSVALDAGVAVSGLSVDQRGITRPQAGAPDIGAFERVPGAGSLVVTTAADENNNTSDPGFGSGTSLREALAYANSLSGAQTVTFNPALAGQIITVSSGWNNESDDTALRATGNVTINGGANSTRIQLSAPVARRVLLNSGTLTLRNVIVSGGNLQGAGDGGGLANYGTATCDTVQFTNNSATYGGAIENFGTLAVRNSTFSGNASQNDGGAIHAAAGSAALQIDNSTFSGNSTSAYASAIASGAQQNTYRYLTITGNTGGTGAIDLYQYPATMIDCIVDGNSPDGIIQLNGGAFSAQSTNNILGSGNSGGLVHGQSGNQLGVPVAQLHLTALANNGGPTPTIALQPESIAVDAGAAINGIEADQRGTTRPQLNAPDVGAFELVATQVEAPIISPSGGSYPEGTSVQIGISVATPNAIVRYTTDGSVPSRTNGQIYDGPVTVNRTTLVQAIAYRPGWIDSQVVNAYYAFASPLLAWMASHGPAGYDATGNPSGDGIANLLKYAFNLAPNPGDIFHPNYQVLTANGTAGLPSLAHDSQGRLVLEFLRRKAATFPGVIYTVETGEDLVHWTALDVSGATVTSIDNIWERISVTDPVVTSKRFGRVRVRNVETYFNDFNGRLGPAMLYGNAQWITDPNDPANGVVQLTDAVSGQAGSIIFDDVVPGSYRGKFSIVFNLLIGPTTSGIPGDGVSFAVGDLPNSPWGEAGPGTAHSLAVGFDTYDNGGNGAIGIHVWVNGAHLAFNPRNLSVNDGTLVVQISYDPASGLTMEMSGTTIFDHIAVPGFSPQPTDRAGFGARTGGANERVLLDSVTMLSSFDGN